MQTRKRLNSTDTIAKRLSELDCSQDQIDRHINRLNQKRPPPKHYHFSERADRWLRQFDLAIDFDNSAAGVI